jgi:hypothetical protein
MTQVRMFTVDVDAATGEWIGQPKEIGQTTWALFNAQPDTDDRYYDRFQHAGDTCAIIVNWIG